MSNPYDPARFQAAIRILAQMALAILAERAHVESGIAASGTSSIIVTQNPFILEKSA